MPNTGLAQITRSPRALSLLALASSLSGCQGILNWESTQLYQLQLSGDLLQPQSAQVGGVIPTVFEAKLSTISGAPTSDSILIRFVAYRDSACTQTYGPNIDESTAQQGMSTGGSISFSGVEAPRQPATLYIRAEGDLAAPSACSASMTFYAGPADRFSYVGSTLTTSGTNQLIKVQLTDSFGNPVPLAVSGVGGIPLGGALGGVGGVGSYVACNPKTSFVPNAGQTCASYDTYPESTIQSDGSAYCSCTLPISGPNVLSMESPELQTISYMPLLVSAGAAMYFEFKPLVDPLPFMNNLGLNGLGFINIQDAYGNLVDSYSGTPKVSVGLMNLALPFDPNRDQGTRLVSFPVPAPSPGASSFPLILDDSAGQMLSTTYIGSAVDLGCGSPTTLPTPGNWSSIYPSPTPSDSVQLSGVNSMKLDAAVAAKCLWLSSANLYNDDTNYSASLQIGSYLGVKNGSSIYPVTGPSGYPAQISLQIMEPSAVIELENSKLNLSSLSFYSPLPSQIVWLKGDMQSEFAIQSLQAYSNITLVIQARLRIMGSPMLGPNSNIVVAPGGTLILESGAYVSSGSISVGPGGSIQIGDGQSLTFNGGSFTLKGTGDSGQAQVSCTDPGGTGYTISASYGTTIDWQYFSINQLAPSAAKPGIDLSQMSGSMHIENGRISTSSTTGALMKLGNQMGSPILSRIQIYSESPSQNSIAGAIFDLTSFQEGMPPFLIDRVYGGYYNHQSQDEYFMSNSLFPTGWSNGSDPKKSLMFNLPGNNGR